MQKDKINNNKKKKTGKGQILFPQLYKHRIQNTARTKLSITGFKDIRHKPG